MLPLSLCPRAIFKTACCHCPCVPELPLCFKVHYTILSSTKYPPQLGVLRGVQTLCSLNFKYELLCVLDLRARKQDWGLLCTQLPAICAYLHSAYCWPLVTIKLLASRIKRLYKGDPWLYLWSEAFLLCQLWWIEEQNVCVYEHRYNAIWAVLVVLSYRVHFQPLGSLNDIPMCVRRPRVARLWALVTGGFCFFVGIEIPWSVTCN